MSSFFQSSDTMPLPPVEKERRSLIRAPLFALIISSLLFLAFYGRCHRVIADQNGEDAVPLKELIRRDITDFDGQLTKLRITDTGHWASLHEQKCKLTVCGKRGDLRCDAGWAMPPNGSKIKDNCGGAGDRIVCCPVESMPTACQWRGGESGRSCHGQCHEGESTLFHSRHATVDCYRPGFQSFCCEATSFKALIEACRWTECKYTAPGEPNKNTHKTTCAGDTFPIASKTNFPDCHSSGRFIGYQDDYKNDLCCPRESAFQGCHWVGQGTCDDNEYSPTDVEVALDRYGDGNRECADGWNGRKKVLCCNTPKNLNPFLPVSLDRIFPTKPPLKNIPKYDLSILGAGSLGSATDGDANIRAFGFLVLDGPSAAVQSLRKRDGSHWHIISCDLMREPGATLQIICMNNELDSNCQDIHEGGVAGTIVAMPDNCGPGSYAVIHSIQPSLSQKLPDHVKRAAPLESVLYEIELNYDFSLVKRDAGDIFIRIDYSNMGGFWENIVKADPASKKRSLANRFWSARVHDWKSKFEVIRSGGIALPSMKFENLDALIIGAGKDKKCKGKGDQGFLSVKVQGDIDLRMRFGFSFVGKLSPNFHLEEAYGFFDTSVVHDGRVEFDGNGKILIHGDAFKQRSILPKPMTAYRFSHPGIVSLGPELDMLATVNRYGELDGKFSTSFFRGNDDTFVTYNQPKSLGDPTGGPGNALPDNAFKGELTYKKTGKPSRKSNTAEPGNILFAMRLFYQTMMKIDINEYGTELDNANITFNQSVDSYMRLEGGENGKIKVTRSNEEAAYHFDSTGKIPGWDQSTKSGLVGNKGKVFSLYEYNKPPAKREAPGLDGEPVFISKDIMQCITTEELICLPLSNLNQFDEDLKNDPETGKPYDEDGPTERTFRRDGGRRTFTVTHNTGSFTMRSPPYPGRANGANLARVNPSVGNYGAEDPFNCENSEITDDYNDSDAVYVTEHILELNYFPAFVQFAITGEQKTANGTTYQTQLNTVNERVLNPPSPFFQDYRTWDPALGNEHPGSPVDRIWQVFSSSSSPHNLVNTERDLNSIKARVWLGRQPMADHTWNHNEWDQAGVTPRDFQRAEEALSYINSVMMVFSYLNDQTINQHLGDSTTNMLHELELFSDRYNAIHNTNIDLGALHREYLHLVLIPRLISVQVWLQRRLQSLQDVWSAQNAQYPADETIRLILHAIQKHLRRKNTLKLNVDRLPAQP